MPERVRNSCRRAAASARFADDDAEHDFVVAAEVFRRAVQDEVGAVLEGAKMDRCRGGRVDDHGRGMRGRSLQVRHRQERVRRCLDPDEVDSVGRRAGLIELDETKPPPFELRGRAQPVP